MDATSEQAVLDELSGLPIAQQLSAEQLATLAGVGSLHEFAAQTVIQREGEQADRLWLVLGGRLSLSLSDAGEVKHIVTTVSRGEFVGWTALVPGMFEQAQAEALKATRCIGFSAPDLRARCEADSAFGFALMRTAFAAAVHRLYDSQVQVIDLYGRAR